MTPEDRFAIRVPASSANLGPGFDSVGIAVDMYLQLEVEKSEEWFVSSSSHELKDLPTDKSHFICQIALQTANKYGVTLQPCRIKVDSDIPMARGLGSSAAAIIAGIELADCVGNLALTKQEKLLLATQIEGHPDNAGASLYGGLVVGCYQKDEVYMVTFPKPSFEMVAVIPQEFLLTKDSREVLPDVFSRDEAAQASATANLLIAALMAENWELAGKMMESDLFHQPYRKPLIQSYGEIEKWAKAKGAFGVALSGAGPTLICFAEKGKGKLLEQSLKNKFTSMTVKLVNTDHNGSSVCKLEKIV